MNTTWIVLGVIVVLVLGLIMIYNGLVAMRQRVNQSFADVDGAGLRARVPWHTRWFVPYTHCRIGDGFRRKSSVSRHDSLA